VSYSVGTIPQTDISASTSFVVDKRIRFTVAGPATGLSVTPGQQDATLSFTITNFTNFDQDFSFAATDETSGTFDGRTDNSDAPGLAAYVDAGVIGTYEPGVDVATFVSALAPDATVNIIVVADYPLTATNAQVANVRLTVRATTAGSSGATPETESATNNQGGAADVVIADNGRDNSEFVVAGYYVSSAALTVTKTAAVVWDPFNDASNPKAIPGARVEYTITVANNGASPATTVTLNDSIPAATTYRVGTLTVNGSSVPDAGNTVGAPVSSISVSTGDIAAGATATVTFQVEIVNVP
jgi:uncharacterized repeat protein (TIGR01451 family)